MSEGQVAHLSLNSRTVKGQFIPSKASRATPVMANR